MPKNAGGRTPSKRVKKRPATARKGPVAITVTIDAEVDRLMEVVRDSPVLFDDRPRSDAIELLEDLIHRCEHLRDELLTEQVKVGD